MASFTSSVFPPAACAPNDLPIPASLAAAGGGNGQGGHESDGDARAALDAVAGFAYPRPQLVRDNWLSLNGRWRFSFDHERRFNAPDDPIDWTREILVPYPPESEASGIGDRGFHRCCWYQRGFVLSRTTGRTLLHFGAVDYQARVWVNGQLVATHEGGHTPFLADITQSLNDDGQQTVTVWVEDDPFDLAKPRGKQDWQLEPHSIWYG